MIAEPTGSGGGGYYCRGFANPDLTSDGGWYPRRVHSCVHAHKDSSKGRKGSECV